MACFINEQVILNCNNPAEASTEEQPCTSTAGLTSDAREPTRQINADDDIQLHDKIEKYRTREEKISIRDYVLRRHMLGVSAKKIHDELVITDGERAPAHRTVQIWIKTLTLGETADKLRSGRPVKVKPSDIQALLDQDAAMNPREMAKRLNVSHSVIYSVMKEMGIERVKKPGKNGEKPKREYVHKQRQRNDKKSLKSPRKKAEDNARVLIQTDAEFYDNLARQYLHPPALQTNCDSFITNANNNQVPPGYLQNQQIFTNLY